MTETHEDRSKVRELAEAVSIQAQVANRLWIAAMTVGIIGVRPSPTPSARLSIDLPFGLGSADPAWFYGMTFGMLAVLIVAFCSAHAQQLRAYKLAVSNVDLFSKKGDPGGGMTLRDLFDLYQRPSIVRMAPLAQILLRFGDGWRTPGTIYYAVLKITATLVYFGLPSWTLFEIGTKLNATGIYWCLAALAGLLAGITVIEVAVIEMIQTSGTTKRLWKLAKPGGKKTA